VSGPHWIIPNGMSGPGNVLTPPDVPISGLTSAAGSVTGAGAGPAGAAADGAARTDGTAIPASAIARAALAATEARRVAGCLCLR
jgi:hypothetical protein